MMKSVYNYIILVCILFVITQKYCINAQVLEVDDESEFDYKTDSDKGPLKWGTIKAEWGACGSGTTQSPVDLANEKPQNLTSTTVLGQRYEIGNATLMNRGHDIQLKWSSDAGSIFLNGTVEYLLRAAHWHTPSEHTINGKSFQVELHLVHTSRDPNAANRIAVVGILFAVGDADPFLSKLMANISSIVDTKNTEMFVGMVDANEIKYSSTNYYSYMGSLTTPPCTEGVIWTLHKEAKTVSIEQLNLLQRNVQDNTDLSNARPVQPTNSRDINIYTEPTQN